MKIKTLLGIVSVIIISTLIKPVFVNSQQNEICEIAQMQNKKPKPPATEMCACEQTSAQEKPTYQVSDSPFGVKTAALRRKASSRKRFGVAASPGAMERTQRTVLLGSLEIPNTDDSNSAEVIGLREKLRKQREEAGVIVERYWKTKINGGRTGKRIRCRPEENCEYKELRTGVFVPPFWTKKIYKDGEYNAELIRTYNQHKDLQNTGDWQLLPKFDWRTRGLDVGQVMNQGKCGSCWAFASVSVYQSALNLERMRRGDEFQDLIEREAWYLKRTPSVQQLLNCIGKEKGDCTDGWHGSAFAFMVNSHVPHIPDRLVVRKSDAALIEEYTGRESVCASPFKTRNVPRGGLSEVPLEGPDYNQKLSKKSDLRMTAGDRALAWGYVNDPFDQMPPVEKLKSALIERGPLAVTILTDYCFSIYKSGVFNGQNNRSVNHVLVLIGWDDEKEAWLVKNSWGKDWGEQGFAWIKYGSNNIGLFAAWIQPSPPTREAMPSE